MGNEITNKWIEAGIAIAIDSDANVLCPVCQKAFLQIIDVRDEKKFFELERHMICKECGAYNALLRPEPLPIEIDA